MHWIVQDNLFDEQGAIELVHTLERFGLPHDIVKIIPISHELVPEINPTNPVMVMGSTALAKVAGERGWIPGSFYNENHDFRRWRQYYGGYLLNNDAEVSRFSDVTPFWKEFFIRPCGDTKEFKGQVIRWPDFADWQKRVIDLKNEFTTLDAKMMVMCASAKFIMQEYRFFVIDRKIVTSSLYKLGDRVIYRSDVDDDVTKFAQRMIDLWCPARGFVLDVALIEDGYRVLEINCLNSAGFYAADVRRLVEAMEAMDFAEII